MSWLSHAISPRATAASASSCHSAGLPPAVRIPSAEVLANPIGSAPGWWVDRDGCVTVLLPGVPSEMRRMWADEVAPRLRSRFSLRPVFSRTIKTWGLGESRIADLLGDLLARPGEGVQAGIYARVRGDDADAQDRHRGAGSRRRRQVASGRLRASRTARRAGASRVRVGACAWAEST